MLAVPRASLHYLFTLTLTLSQREGEQRKDPGPGPRPYDTARNRPLPCTFESGQTYAGGERRHRVEEPAGLVGDLTVAQIGKAC